MTLVKSLHRGDTDVICPVWQWKSCGLASADVLAAGRSFADALQAIRTTSSCSSCVFMYVHVTHALWGIHDASILHRAHAHMWKFRIAINKLFEWLFYIVLTSHWGGPGLIPGRDMSVLGPQVQYEDDLGQVSVWSLKFWAAEHKNASNLLILRQTAWIEPFPICYGSKRPRAGYALQPSMTRKPRLQSYTIRVWSYETFIVSTSSSSG